MNDASPLDGIASSYLPPPEDDINDGHVAVPDVSGVPLNNDGAAAVAVDPSGIAVDVHHEGASNDADGEMYAFDGAPQPGDNDQVSDAHSKPDDKPEGQNIGEEFEPPKL